jgi:hypothetical protein
MHRRQFATFLLAAIAAALLGCETPPRYGEVRVHDRDYDVRVVFSDQDRVLIRDYYGPPPRGLPPGLAKKGKVPPGHAWRMQRHAPLPPEAAWQPLPYDLDRRLSRLPEGYARVIVGGDVGIMDTRTRMVLDVVTGITD